MNYPILSLLILFLSNSYCQLNFDNSYSTINKDLHPELLIEGGNSSYYALGDSLLLQVDSAGNVLFAKEIDCVNPVDFTSTNTFELYYGQIKTDSNGKSYSVISKRDPLGNLIWERLLGSGHNEVRVGAIHANNDGSIMLGGALVSDSVWHNFVSKFSAGGSELWTRKFEQYSYVNQIKNHKDVQIIKITQSIDNYYYALSKIDNNTLIYEVQGDGVLSGFFEYSYQDSLIPVDIKAVSENDIQVLCTSYSTLSHTPERSIVKFRIDADMSIYNAREYKKTDVLLDAVDLDVKNGQCFILGNGKGQSHFSLIERTTLEGYHNQTREVQDQNWNQSSTSLIARNDQSIIHAYRLENDSTSILSATNTDLRSACDFFLGSITSSDIILNQEIATSLLFSAGDPLVQTDFSTTNNLTGVTSANHCFGAIGFEEAETEFKVYPNPANDFTQIEINSMEEYSVQIINPTGSIIFSAQNPKYINLTSFPSGIYHLLLTTENRRITQQLVIQH